MRVSGRRRSSKWDLKDEQRHSYETACGIPRHEKEDMPLHDRELEQGWFSPEVAGRNRDRWPSMEASDLIRPKHALRESLRGNRSSYDSDRIATDVAPRRVGDDSYIMKTSRDVDDWRQEKHHRSPRNDWTRPRRSRSRSWSRSRSRSPVQNFRRQSGFDDRSRSRSVAHPPICRDFSAGRCRRGSQCPFLHQDVNHEDDWDTTHRNNGAPKYSASHDSKDYSLKSVRSTCIDFLKGNCRRGASCRFAHDSDSDGLGRVNEITREKDTDRRIRSPERDGERESRKSSDIPCKYFSAGNCRNGRFCRFSHHLQPRPSPEKRLHDDNREHRRNSVNAEIMRDVPKWSNSDYSDEKEKAWNGLEWGEKDALSDRGAMNELDKTWTGPKWTGDKDEDLTVSEPRLSGWGDDSGWQHGPDVNRAHGDLRVNISMVGNGMTDNPNIKRHVSEQRIAEESLDDMEMSPDWNFRIETSKNIGKIENPQLPQSSKALRETSVLTHGQSTTKGTSGQTCEEASILEPKSNERSYFQEDSLMRDISAVDVPYVDTNVAGKSDLNFSSNSVAGQSSLTYSSSHTVGQSRFGVSSVPHGGSVDICHNPALFPEVNLSNASNIGNTNMSQVSSGIPSQNIVSNEQLTQLSNLTASLAQILGSTQQLPQLSAALNSHNTVQVPSFSIPAAMHGGSTQPDLALAVKLNHDIASQKQYDPLSDSIESTKRNLSTTSSGLATIPVEQKYTDEQHNRYGSEKGQIFESHQSGQQNATANSAHINENNAAGNGEIKRDMEDNGPAEYVDGDEKAEESKKNKDSKGIRAFKFTLAEFVKDLLKPAWKEGQISKEAYKNIVKKVVEKVTATVQGASIPQTQEKIDQYLSSSKPKLNKLVQAYVEKSQKAK